MMQEQEEIKVRSKVAKLLFLSLLMVLVGMVLIFEGAESRNYLFLAIGSVNSAIFSLGLLFSVSKLIKSEPALLINQEGIVDKSSLAGAGAVAPHRCIYRSQRGVFFYGIRRLSKWVKRYS